MEEEPYPYEKVIIPDNEFGRQPEDPEFPMGDYLVRRLFGAEGAHETPDDQPWSLADIMGMILSQAGERGSDGYEVFYDHQSREELYDIGKGLSEYVRDNDISTVCFLDRAARPAYLAMTGYWNLHHKGEKKPNIRFINPKGCIAQEDLAAGRVWGDKLRINDEIKEGRVEPLTHMKPTSEIVDEIQAGMTEEEKNGRILLFDTCVHSGDSLYPVRDKLLRAGIRSEQLRIGVVNDDENQSGIKPDFMVFPDVPSTVCYPFGHDSMTRKIYGSVTAERNPNPHDREAARTIRGEIIRAIREIDEEESQTASA